MIDYLWKPIYLWLKYFFIVFFGKTPLLELNDGRVFSIHPSAIRNLSIELDHVSFICSINSLYIEMNLVWSDIKKFSWE